MAAAISAASRISSVIIGSALTVIVGSAAMVFADLGIFSTTGPAIAVSVAVALLVALTLTPAALALGGSRGLMDPRPARDRSVWSRLSAVVIARPARVLALGLVPLIVLAAFYPLMRVSFDERDIQPDDTGSNQGYALLAEHFPVNEALPDFVLVTADRDLRNSRDLAALEQLAGSVARTEGVVSVRGVTRPLGEPITEASIGHQAGRIGAGLTEAEGRLADGQTQAARLSDGARQVDDGAGQVADGASAAASGAGRVLTGVDRLKSGLDRLVVGAGDAEKGSAQLRAGAAQLADALDAAYAQTKPAVDGLALAHDALTRSLTCSLDPYCKGARDGIRRIYEGQRDQLLPGLQRAAAGARSIAAGNADLADGLGQLESGLRTARSGAGQVADGQSLLSSKLGELADGAEQVSVGTGQVSDGTSRTSASVGELRKGLDQAAAYLRGAGRAAADPAVGGFYLPPEAFSDSRMKTATSLFLSPTGTPRGSSYSALPTRSRGPRWSARMPSAAPSRPAYDTPRWRRRPPR